MIRKTNMESEEGPFAEHRNLHGPLVMFFFREYQCWAYGCWQSGLRAGYEDFGDDSGPCLPYAGAQKTTSTQGSYILVSRPKTRGIPEIMD